MNQKLRSFIFFLLGVVALNACSLAVDGADAAAVSPTVSAITIPTAVPPTTVPATITSSTSEETATETAVSPTATTVPSATAVTVFNTNVQYIMALTDVNVRSGPGTGYNIISWVADGQTAKVTGVNSDNSWWRVICPDDTIGSCWATANSQYTQATTPPSTQPLPTPTTSACIDAATFISDVTVPDGTQLLPNSSFNKMWRIKNSGTCTWDYRYKFVHAGGYTLGAFATEFPLPVTAAPGQTIDLSVNLIAPSEAGVYEGDWKLQNAQGQRFGIGQNRNSPFWVKIVVPSSLPTSSITGWLWNDYCVADEEGIIAGNCMADGSGGFRADSMIQPTEGYIAGVTILLQEGPCATDNPAPPLAAVTDATGKYSFHSLPSGTYCVFMNAAQNGNGSILLPGDWTFPQPHIWYQQITLVAGEQITSINFGWDYQME